MKNLVAALAASLALAAGSFAAAPATAVARDDGAHHARHTKRDDGPRHNRRDDGPRHDRRDDGPHRHGPRHG
jgi:Ni/Co efflux regulator RcnB